MDERLKSALGHAAEAIKILQSENSALISDNDELLAKLAIYRESFGEIPANSSSVSAGSFDMSVLQKKLKASLSKPKKQMNATSAVLSTWGGGSTVQFSEPEPFFPPADADKDALDANKGTGVIKSNKQKRTSNERLSAVKKTVSCKASLSRKRAKLVKSSSDDTGNDSDIENECDASDESSDADKGKNLGVNHKDKISEVVREQGWSDVRHFIPMVISSGDAPSVVSPSTEPIVLNVLGGLTRDNVYSCAALISSFSAVTVAGHLQSCLPRVIAGFDGSVLVTECSLLQDHLESAGSTESIISTIPNSNFGPEALFSPALSAKLLLISDMLAAVNTRTNAGPMYMDTLLEALKYRCHANLRRDLLNPLRIIFCGDRGERMHSLLAESGAAAAAQSEDAQGRANMLMQNDFSYSDSDSDTENTVTLVKGRRSVLSVEEMNRSVVGFVLVAASLRCGRPNHACAFVKELSCQATNISCLGTTLGALAGINAFIVNSASASSTPPASSKIRVLNTLPALDVYLSNLGKQLSRTGSESGFDDDLCWRAAALRLASTECVNLAAALSSSPSRPVSADFSHAAARRELQIRGHGTFAILARNPEGSIIQDALSLAGAQGVNAYSEIIVRLLRISGTVTVDKELATLFATTCLNEKNPPLTLATAERCPTESSILQAFEQHWDRRLSIAGATVPASRQSAPKLQEAAKAFTDLREYFSASFCSEFDVLEGGWRVGAAGKGEDLGVRIAVAMERCGDALHKMGAVISITPNGADSMSLQLYAFSSASPDSIAQLSSSIHQCLILGTDFYAPIVADLASLLAAAALERLQFLIYCSALSLLRVVIEAPGHSTSEEEELGRGGDGLVLIEQLARFLMSSRCFWHLPVRAEVAYIIQSAVSILLAESQSKCVTNDLEAFVYANRKRLPVFIINLDRRLDRFRKCIMAAEAHELLLMRVSAVDGLNLDQSDSFGDGPFNGSDERSVRIPLEEVTMHWDSTLNSRFDSYCVVNAFTPMTNSERACAASHVKTWKIIRQLRHELGLGHSPDAGLDNDLTDDNLETQRRAITYRECCRGRDDWYLIFEDDASISAEEARKNGSFLQAIERTMQAAPSDYDIIYLGWAIPFVKDNKAVNSILLRPNYLWQLHAYILRGSAVEKLLGALPVNAPLDNFVAALIHGGSLIAYALKDQLVRQDGSYKARQGESDIRHSGRDDVALRRGKLL